MPHDLLRFGANEFRSLSPEELKTAIAHLSPEDRRRLSPTQVAAIMAASDSRFEFTPDEERRRQAALQLADPSVWRQVASSYVEPVVRTYKAGEIDLSAAIQTLGRVSIGCMPQDRVQVLGVAAALLIRTTVTAKRKPGATKPLYPACVKSGTADLILSLKASEPDQRRSPTAYDPTSPIITKALSILGIMKWFGDAGAPAQTTIDGWVRKRLAEQQQSQPQARPKRQRKSESS